jgi:hypothetical protein
MDTPSKQDREQQPIPPAPTADDGDSARCDENLPPGKHHIPSLTAKSWMEVALLVFGLIAVPLGIKAWLEAEVEKSVAKTLSDEVTLRKIAAQSRPSLVFSAKESIVTDMGAVQYLYPKDASVKDIRVTKRINGGIPQHIHIGFSRFLSIAPILTSLYDVTQITAERGRGLDWEFEIDWNPIPGGKKDADIMFRLEVIP